MALQMGLPPHQAAEATQRAWMKFIERGPRFSEPNADECRAWLQHVLPNEVANLFRERKRRPRQWPPNPEEDLTILGTRESADHDVFLRRSELFRAWLEELGQKDSLRHDLVFARHILGEKPQELAQRYGKDPHWISQQINRALNSFRAWLVKHGHLKDDA